MAKNEQPVFTRAGVNEHGTISVANANLDGSGTLVTVADGQTEGVRIDQIEIKAIGTTTLGMVRIFLSINGGGNFFLWREIPVAAIIPSGTVEAFSAVIDLTTALNDPPLVLADTNDIIAFATENAESFECWVRGGAFAA